MCTGNFIANDMISIHEIESIHWHIMNECFCSDCLEFVIQAPIQLQFHHTLRNAFSSMIGMNAANPAIVRIIGYLEADFTTDDSIVLQSSHYDQWLFGIA